MKQSNNNSLVNFEGIKMPNAVALERNILGAMLLDSEAIARLSDVLQADSFFVPAHTVLYEVLLKLFYRNTYIDQHIVIDHLERNDLLDNVGGYKYIMQLTNISSISNYMHNAAIVEELAARRRIFYASIKAANDALNPDTDVFGLVSGYQKSLQDAYANSQDEKDVTPSGVGMEMIKHMERMALAPSYVVGVPFGVRELDKLTGGGHPSNLVTIGMRTRVGKSATAIAFMYHSTMVPLLDADGRLINNIFKSKYPAAFFSQEMRAIEVFVRMTSEEVFRISGHTIPYEDIALGRFKPSYKPFIQKAVQNLMERGFYIDDSPALNTVQLKTKLMRYKDKYGITHAYIDYIQLMRALKVDETKTTADKIAIIMAELKTIAKQLNICIVVLSQLSRETEKGGGVRPPIITDMKGSGGIEENSDVIILGHRPEIYYTGRDDGSENEHGIMYLDVVKNKQGSTGLLKSKFNVMINTFTETDFSDLQSPEYLAKKQEIEEGMVKFVDDFKVYLNPDKDDDAPF